jgi:von Willebrand factor type A domain/Aerotolerance regulator N-terminal
LNILEFANPIGWWWLALALPIIGFYILKVRLRRQPVSTMLFWDKVFDEKKPRAWWQQLRHWLSLLLQLALLLLFVSALVDPLWSWQKNQRRKIVLVVDNSASMAAIEDGKSRFDKAKLTATALARSLRVGDEMAILTAGGNSTVAIGLTGHVRSLIEAIDRIELTDAPNSLTTAVEMAKRLVPPSKQSQLILLTDGCDSAIEELKNDEAITLYGFGTSQDNVAITQFQVRRSLLDAIGYQVLVEVSNFGSEPRKCRLELNLEEELVDVVPIELEPGASKTLNLDHASATGGRLVAQLDVTDGISVDNRALAVLPTRRKMPITLATAGSVFLKSVLESIPLVDLSIVESLPEDWRPARDSILVLHQNVPSKLPPGKLLVINPRNNCDLWTVGEPIETPLVSTVDDASPVTQHVRLTNVLFPDARALAFTGESETLIKTPLDEPLLSYIRRPAGDILVLNVDLDLGDLPLRIAFPVLMKNAVEWFQGNQGELQPALATGQAATVLLPRSSQAASNRLAESKAESKMESEQETADAVEVLKASATTNSSEDYMLRSPAGALTPLARDESSAVLSMLNYCGLWTIGTDQALKRDPWVTGKLDNQPTESDSQQTLPSDEAQLVRVACNLCSREESDLKPRVQLDSPSDFGMLSLGGRSIWFYLVLAGLVLLAIEWWLYQRRVVG